LPAALYVDSAGWRHGSRGSATEDTGDFIGLRSRSPAEFVATVRDVAPSIEVDAVEPGRRLAL